MCDSVVPFLTVQNSTDTHTQGYFRQSVRSFISCGLFYPHMPLFDCIYVASSCRKSLKSEMTASWWGPITGGRSEVLMLPIWAPLTALWSPQLTFSWGINVLTGLLRVFWGDQCKSVSAVSTHNILHSSPSLKMFIETPHVAATNLVFQK